MSIEYLSHYPHIIHITSLRVVINEVAINCDSNDWSDFTKVDLNVGRSEVKRALSGDGYRLDGSGRIPRFIDSC